MNTKNVHDKNILTEQPENSQSTDAHSKDAHSEDAHSEGKADKKEGLTRRQIIVAAGAVTTATAGLGAITLGSSKAEAASQWDQQADIVVVGSGIGAATAALKADDNGDSVVLIEKSPLFGGTSAKTAGVFWIPNNFTLKEKGIKDSREDCLEYLARFSSPEKYNKRSPNMGLGRHALSLLEAFYDNASSAIDFLRSKAAFNVAEWRMFHLDRSATDYLDNIPENKVPTGRALGVLTSKGVLGSGVDMMEQLETAISKRNIPLMLNHRAVRLVLNDKGRVLGLESEHNGKVVSIKARKAVVFATGGYVHSPDSVAQYQRNHIYGACAIPMATGDFVNIAGAAGARLGNMSGAWRTQVVLEETLKSSKLAGGVFFPPGDSVIQVNKYGLRVVNENRNYNDRTEIHSVYDPTRAEYPNQLMFMIYDQRSAEAFAGVYPLPQKPTAAAYVLKADSLPALASKISKRLKKLAGSTGDFSLDNSFTENLKTSVSRYNDFAQTGKDEDFRRGEAGYDSEWHLAFSPQRTDTKWPLNKNPSVTMHPLRAEGPFYAIMLAAGALDTNGGPVVDASARIMDTHGKPIPGLYGAGNCIASPSRESYWGAGCPLGLSLTYGYIAANAANKEPRKEV